MTPQGSEQQESTENIYFEKNLADTPIAPVPCHVGLVSFLRTHRSYSLRVGLKSLQGTPSFRKTHREKPTWQHISKIINS
jgi:hypothetical protein